MRYCRIVTCKTMKENRWVPTLAAGFSFTFSAGNFSREKGPVLYTDFENK